MLTVERKYTIHQSSEAVWQKIGDFGAIHKWHPAVSSCTVEVHNGAKQRILLLADGAKLVEQRIDDGKKINSYTYKIIAGPLPVENYQSTLAVVNAEGGSEIRWTGSFTALGCSDDEAKAAIADIYEAGLTAVGALLQ